MITTINEWKKNNVSTLNENKKNALLQILSQEVIKDDLIIDRSFEKIPEELIKVKIIKGDVDLTTKRGYIPSWLKDVKIYGYFDCSYNKLTSLENCPQYVGSNFDCSWNKLTSLKGCPKYIGDSLICNANDRMLRLPQGIRLKGEFDN